MPEGSVPGITITNDGDNVVIEVEGGRWEGSAAQAERLLTALPYALNRARPGTNIASLFLNGQLWGGKAIETDRRAAIRDMREALERLSAYVTRLDEEQDATT